MHRCLFNRIRLHILSPNAADKIRMTKVGVRAHDYGRDTPHSLFAKIRGDGFSCIQLAFQKAITGVNRLEDITPVVVNQVSAATQKHELSVAVLGYYIEPALPDETLRRENSAGFTEGIKVAKALSADCIATETTNQNKQAGMTRKEAQNALLRTLWEIMPAAEQNGVTVAVEPVYYHTLNTPELAREVLESIASPNLKIIFDPVNLLAPEEVHVQDQLWERCFACFGDRIAAVHIKGIALDEQNRLTKADLSHSIVNYRIITSYLKQLSQNFSVLREEANPATAHFDCDFIKHMLL